MRREKRAKEVPALDGASLDGKEKGGIGEGRNKGTKII